MLDALGWRDEIDLALSPADVGRGRPAPDMILGAMAAPRVWTTPPPWWSSATPSAISRPGTRAGAGAVVGVLSGAHDEATLRGAPHTAIIADVTELVALLDGRQAEPAV